MGFTPFQVTRPSSKNRLCYGSSNQRLRGQIEGYLPQPGSSGRHLGVGGCGNYRHRPKSANQPNTLIGQLPLANNFQLSAEQPAKIIQAVLSAAAWDGERPG